MSPLHGWVSSLAQDREGQAGGGGGQESPVMATGILQEVSFTLAQVTAREADLQLSLETTPADFPSCCSCSLQQGASLAYAGGCRGGMEEEGHRRRLPRGTEEPWCTRERRGRHLIPLESESGPGMPPCRAQSPGPAASWACTFREGEEAAGVL